MRSLGSCRRRCGVGGAVGESSAVRGANRFGGVSIGRTVFVLSGWRRGLVEGECGMWREDYRGTTFGARVWAGHWRTVRVGLGGRKPVSR